MVFDIQPYLDLDGKLSRLSVPTQFPDGRAMPLGNRIKVCVDVHGWGAIADYPPLVLPAEPSFDFGAPQPIEARPTSQLSLTSGQEKAWRKLLKFLASSNRYFILRGYAGTGKTFLIKKLLEDHSLLLTAPTNKAAKVMKMMLGSPAKTIYSQLGITMDAEDETLVLKYPDELPKAIRGATLVIDECSMINRKLLEFILRAANELDLKIIFVGDPAQLRPVGEVRSPVWSLPVPKECKALLTEVKRFDDQLLVLATAIRGSLKDKSYDLDLREYADGVKVHALSNHRFEATMLKYAGKSRVIAWRNKTVEAYNEAIRRRLGFLLPYCPGDLIMTASPVKQDGSIIATIDEEFTVRDTKEVTISGLPAHRLFCAGSEDESLTLNVPTRAGRRELDSKLTILAEAAKEQKISSAERRRRWTSFWDLKNSFHRVRYGWAITAHRAQGSTFDRVFVDQQDVLANRETREAYQCLYVGCTRPSDELFFNF